MYRLIEDEWERKTTRGIIDQEPTDTLVTYYEDFGAEFRIEKGATEVFPYVVICELANDFSRETCCRSFDEVVEWMEETCDLLGACSLINIAYEEVPWNETEDDCENYSLFSKKELDGL